MEPSANPLEKYTTNYTKLAQERKLDPVIGRDEEIRRLMQILSRRTKNNPILLGDPGVGKTALVEGLSQRIVSGDVPAVLANRELISLDLASILAGASYRGEFERRLKEILSAVEKAKGKYILFIDEIHTLVGAGAGEGAIDAANMLKPALARGLLRAIGATTIKEYRRYIEKDQALARRFQPIFVDEPSAADSVAILRGIKHKYELHHGIRITDDSLIAAVELSRRYISDRFLPDKAIDLLDEAAAGLKIEIDSSPTRIDTLERSIIQDEIELTALKRENDSGNKAKIAEKKNRIEHKKEELKSLKEKWVAQKKILTQLNTDRTRLDNLKGDLAKAEHEALLEKAAEIKYGQIPQVEKNLKEAEGKWHSIPKEDRLIKEKVDADDIGRIVAKWTGIPVERMLRSEEERLLKLEDDLHQRVVNQTEAITRISRAIRRSRAGFGKENAPIGVFLFVGPTGVGKTETAKALAYSLFNDENALIRIDMSEYSEPHSVARLVGAPPGYVGYEEGGQLTEQVRRHPYSVILFDEIEKAHPLVFNLFLQLFDDGRLTDGQGRVVNFANTIIIMTSNIGSTEILDQAKDKNQMKEKVLQQVHQFFRPEILNRIGSIVVFDSLTPALLRKIVDLQIKQLQDTLTKRSIKIIVKPEVVDYLIKYGFDPVFGARPLKRLIEETIVDEISYQYIDRKITEGDQLVIGINKNQITVGKHIVN